MQSSSGQDSVDSRIFQEINIEQNYTRNALKDVHLSIYGEVMEEEDNR
jgi:hypothetical protein